MGQLARLSLLLLLACRILHPAAAQGEEAMETANGASGPSQAENLRVAELVYYVSDFERALAFYRDGLGWTPDWQGQGYGAVDVLGQYKLTLISAAVMEPGWKVGQPLPPGQLCLQSNDIAATRARLQELGIDAPPLPGEAGQMRSFTFTCPEGHGVFVFEDPSSYANVNRPGESKAPYAFAEALLFTTDLDASEMYFNSLLGSQTFIRHGGVYRGLAKEGGLAIGVMLWEAWFDKPAAGTPPAPPRLTVECADIAAEHARLRANGVELEELKSEADGLHWFSLQDPDGNLISFWQYKQ
jgi:catechol 2,3-dioxygenase-like lactoylglutathione lyase family enzyme